MMEKIERLKEWFWAAGAAIAVNGYVHLDLTVIQRILLLYMLWLIGLFLIYFVEERLENLK